jgi:hypothetical protein
LAGTIWPKKTAHGLRLIRNRPEKRRLLIRTPWKNRLGLSQKFSGRQMGAFITWPRNLFWNILMVDIDEILADAIRTTWLQVNGPESRPPHHIELAIARRVRAVLERKGIIMTPSRPPPEAGALKEAGRSHHARHS